MKIETIFEDNPQNFCDKVIPYLLKNEAMNNLMLGICNSLKNNILQAELMMYLTNNSEVIGVALQSKKRGLVFSPMEKVALDALASKVKIENILTLVGEKESTQYLVPLLEKRFGVKFELTMDQGIYELKKVIPAKKIEGQFRQAMDNDYDQVLSFTDSFVAESLPKEYNREHIVEMVSRRLKSRDFFFWDINAEAVSIAALGGPTTNGIRVGVVYTPKELRGKGFASATVSSLSQWALDQGYKSVFLYTDLKNPTSNSIYQKIGYRRVGDSLMYSMIQS
jgi:predicted GNAT family acetyltransferase